MKIDRLKTGRLEAAIGLLLSWGLASDALAQSTNAIPNGFQFSAQASTSISASNTSASASLSNYPFVVVTNETNSPACFAWGAAPIAAYPCSSPYGPVSPGQSALLPVQGATNLAAILGTSGASGTISTQEGWISPIGSSTPIGTVVTQTLAASTTDSSITITTGGTFQQALASNASRKTLEVQNICAVSGNCVATTDNCYVTTVAYGSATKSNSFFLAPGSYYGRLNGVVPSDAIAITCDGTGDKVKVAVQ